MKGFRLMFTLLIATTFAFGTIACEKKEGPIEEAAEAVGADSKEPADKVEEAGEKVEEAAEELGDKAEEAGEEIKEAAEDGAAAVEGAVEGEEPDGEAESQ